MMLECSDQSRCTQNSLGVIPLRSPSNPRLVTPRSPLASSHSIAPRFDFSAPRVTPSVHHTAHVPQTTIGHGQDFFRAESHGMGYKLSGFLLLLNRLALTDLCVRGCIIGVWGMRLLEVPSVNLPMPVRKPSSSCQSCSWESRRC